MIAKDTARNAYEARMSFYDQFSSNLIRECAITFANTAAAIALVLGVASGAPDYQHPMDCT